MPHQFGTIALSQCHGIYKRTSEGDKVASLARKTMQKLLKRNHALRMRQPD